ncbi:MAG: Wadjet anti-phage system protein JetA family protein, partial [Bacilli bacterium]
LRSYENTKKLKVELITLVHSIRIFQNKLGKVFQTNDVLHDYFDVYKTKISDRYYHPLKTFDSVAKFKRPIIRILEKWLTDKDVREKMIMQAAVLSHVENKNKIEQDIIEKINYISDTYENLGGLISSIDKENSSYTKSSTNKILYLNNNDRSIKGYLENIFKLYVKATNNPRNLGTILSQMQNSIYFYEQGYIDSDSVTLPILRKFKYDSTPLEVVDFDAASEFVMDNFLRETNNIYTDERIYGFMQKAFGSSDTLEIKDIPLIDYDAFICLILATVMKDDENCFYTIENIDDTKIRNHNFIVPNLIFHKKEEN